MKNKLLIFLTVLTNSLVGQYATLPFTDDFEGGGTSLGSNWSTEYQDGNGVIDRRNELGSWPKFTFSPATKGTAYTSSTDPSGNGMAIYRTANASSAQYESAILSVDLYNKGGINISFNIVDWGTGYGGSMDSLKVYISNNGGTSYGSTFTLVNLNQGPYNDGFWNTVNIDISALATTNSMVMTATSKIKFTFNLKGSGNTTSPKSGNQFIYLDNFSVTTTGPLPVELIQFEGTNKGNYNLLTWITASEINNDYFELQSSIDGVNFESISKISGAGNSYSMTSYQFEDKPLTSTTYYRLKQVDFDGTTTYFDVIVIKTNNTEKRLIGIYDILGQPVNSNYEGVQILIYSNGEVIKISKQFPVFNAIY